jgi:hypothetical protein
MSVLVVGCGSNDEGFTGEEGEVAAVVEHFLEAVEQRDATTICNELIAPTSFPGPTNRKRCERAYSGRGKEAIQTPGGLEIASISIEGDSARVSYAEGKGFTELVSDNGRWYVSLAR